MVTNSLEMLKTPNNLYQTKWQIVSREVHDDSELDAFIKSRYGAGCSLGEKVASAQAGVYDVRIQGDGKDASETLCLLNYATVVKYYPAGNRVIAWNLGQGPTFVADVAHTTTYDREMVESFRMLTYGRVEIAEAGLSVEVPASWLQLDAEWDWVPLAGSSLHLGLKWVDLMASQEAEAVLLPQPGQVIDSQEITWRLLWGIHAFWNALAVAIGWFAYREVTEGVLFGVGIGLVPLAILFTVLARWGICVNET